MTLYPFQMERLIPLDFDSLGLKLQFELRYASEKWQVWSESKMAATDTTENGNRNNLKTIWRKMMCDTCKHTDFDIRKTILALFS